MLKFAILSLALFSRPLVHSSSLCRRVHSYSSMAISISQVRTSQPTPEGDGATVFRVIGTAGLRNLDPFLMLDEFHVKAPAGFPSHPHRGFETVTYMLDGAFTHKDFAGHEGTIMSGDLQWMTAGRGIIHSEMPVGEAENIGLQLWVNLASKDKMIPPAYQELRSKDIPERTKDGVSVKIIAGSSMGVDSPVLTRTPTLFLDVRMDANSRFVQNIPEGFQGFSYIIDGEANFGAECTKGVAHQMMVFRVGGTELEVVTGDKSARFVVIAGKPLNEPIFQHGPFVMNTREEIIQAFSDYQYRRNGFEGSSRQ